MFSFYNFFLFYNQKDNKVTFLIRYYNSIRMSKHTRYTNRYIFEDT